MNKNSLLALGIGFIAGVGLTWSYFNAASSYPESVKSQPSYEKQKKLHTEQQSNEVLSNTGSAPEQVASIEPAEVSPTTNSETQMLDELPLEEQVTQLKQQLAEQKAALKSVLKKMRGLQILSRFYVINLKIKRAMKNGLIVLKWHYKIFY
ncbi:hypothetical protein [Pseudoalteromonas sp. SR41-7]|uniref:hypothetical protein n=1 Tax=Pseudoalteromonas sp. SR41-7 TaxID=2760947 RepID=UPI0021759B7E|nr:hypothetical protein [Pseudoalteromonas sp. SR41-7]